MSKIIITALVTTVIIGGTLYFLITKEEETMAMIYVQLIIKGRRTYSSVPNTIKPQVKKAIITWITSIHDRNKKIDTYSSEIDNVKAAIQDLKEDNDAKMRIIREEQCIITESMLAVLDGINQIGGNGPVTENKEKLTAYLNSSAHHNTF